MPKNETFVFPSALKNQFPGTDGWCSMDYNRSFNQLPIYKREIILDEVRNGATTNDYLNVSITNGTELYGIIGNVTYIEIGETVPEDQDGRVFIFEEEEGVNDQLNNLTNSSSIIVIHDDNRAQQYWANTTNCTSQIARLTKDSNNMTTVIEMLENDTDMMVDNLLDNDTLTFTHNFDYVESWWPDNDNFYILGKYPSTWKLFGLYTGIIYTYNFEAILMGWPLCYGFIFYDNYLDVHHMEHTTRHWRGWDNNQPRIQYNINYPALQIFSINRTVGEWLENRTGDPNTKVTGYFEQEALDVEAYNVIGNITIDESPGDAIVILSNRYDGWWGETPGDSGAGGGILLGIAKYFHDYNITPKYNLTFLFTTGEEYGMRGAWYHSMSRPSENITRWIGTDQLGFIEDGNGQVTLLSDNSLSGDKGITNAIADMTNLEEDSGYGYDTEQAKDPSNTDEAAFRWRGVEFGLPCNTTCIVKTHIGEGVKWGYHHRAGKSYTEGDSMKYIDRDDLNATFNFTWGIIKYYTVNPDCWLSGISYDVLDSENDGDSLNDTIQTTFTMNTILPVDKVQLEYTVLKKVGESLTEYSKTTTNYSVNSSGLQKTYTFNIPDNETSGEFAINLKIYNSTARINEIVGITPDEYNHTTTSSAYQLYHPLGYPAEGSSTQNVEDRITGVAFTANENASANNITVYLQADFSIPPPKGTCMIYRSSDSALIGTTGEIIVTTSARPEWKVFTFYADPQPQLVQGVEYVITCWSDKACNVYYDDSSFSKGRYYSYTYGTPPLLPLFTNEDRLSSMYCAYTPN